MKGKSDNSFRNMCLVFMVITCLISGGLIGGFLYWAYLWGNHNNDCFNADIGVEKDNQFKRRGFSGSGKLDDPYRLENLELTVSGIGISICSTEAYFVISNCVITGGYYLINLENVKVGTARIENNTFILRRGWSFGVIAYSSPGTIIANNTFLCAPEDPIYDYDMDNIGVSIEYSENCVVTDNEFYNLNIGIRTESDTSSLIKNNYFQNTIRGIYSFGSNELQIVTNHYFNNTIAGVYLYNVFSGNVLNNTYLNNTQGIILSVCFNMTIRYNQFQTSVVYGIRIENSFYLNIFENNFIDNHMNGTTMGFAQAYDFNEQSYQNSWCNSTITLGNYWSDLAWNATAIYSIDSGSAVDQYPLENQLIL